MERNDVREIIKAVLATVTLSSLVCGPFPRAIADAPKTNTVRPAPPVVMSEGVRITAEPERPAYAPGEHPVVLLTATNTRQRAADLEVIVAMTRTGPASPMSRVVTMPTTAWSTVCRIRLRGKQTRTFSLRSDVAVGAGDLISFTIQSGSQHAAGAPLAVSALRGQILALSNPGSRQ